MIKNYWLKLSEIKPESFQFVNYGHCGWVFEIPCQEPRCAMIDPIRFTVRYLTSRIVISNNTKEVYGVWSASREHGEMVRLKANLYKEQLIEAYKDKYRND